MGVVPYGKRFEEGISYMRINSDNHNFCLMPTPEGGFKSKI